MTQYEILSRKIKSDSSFKNEVFNFTNFLSDGSTIICRLWHYINKINYIPKCVNCNNPTSFNKLGGIRKGYNKYCCGSCKMTYINLNRSEQDTIDRKNKIRNTCIKKYGVEHYFSSNEIKEKKLSTYRKNYGVDNPSQLDEVKAKKIATCIKNYGVDNPSKCIEIQAKKSRVTKNKTLISLKGKVYLTEGYESIAIKELFSLGYKDEDILNRGDIKTCLGSIEYEFEGTKKVYHPDIYLRNENKIIEVKSLYWYIRELSKNMAKKKACIDKNLNFEFWVYDPKSRSKVIQ
jgi:transposase-like protein